jgi:hypothetical protein
LKNLRRNFCEGRNARIILLTYWPMCGRFKRVQTA